MYLFKDNETEKNYIYVTTCKCGSQSLIRILKEHYNARVIGWMHNNRLQKDHISFPLFAVTRNPYDRAISLWKSTTQRGKDRYRIRERFKDYNDFEKFLGWISSPQFRKDCPDLANHPLFASQKKHLRFVRGYLKTNGWILRLEEIEQSFTKLPFYKGEKINWAERINVTSTEDNRPLLTDKAIRRIHEIYGDDFDEFRYSKELPKRYCS